jgi:hypothetical protein
VSPFFPRSRLLKAKKLKLGDIRRECVSQCFCHFIKGAALLCIEVSSMQPLIGEGILWLHLGEMDPSGLHLGKMEY